MSAFEIIAEENIRLRQIVVDISDHNEKMRTALKWFIENSPLQTVQKMEAFLTKKYGECRDV